VKLSDLIKSVTPVRINDNNMDPEITSLHYRAETVLPGGLFFAVSGHVVDGHSFIDEALAKGASAIIAQKPVQKDSVIIEVENTRKALSAISARFYNEPSRRLNVTGITGTNGKTTITYLIESILNAAGVRVGVIGTVNYRYSGKIFKNPMTTPESMDLQKILSEMVNEGVTHVVLEISSHALDLNRVDHCLLNIGVFTNLSQDHLDYHRDMESYWACKKKMFYECLTTGAKSGEAKAVINCCNEYGRLLAENLAEQFDELSVMSLGRTGNEGSSGNENINLVDAEFGLNGTTGRISTPVGDVTFKSTLVGKYNLENILCAAGVGIVLGLSVDEIKAGIENFSCVPGRLERIENNTGRFVFVDYAHTPDALENVLTAVGDVTNGRIISIFGCGGDRDMEKRPLMGEIAGRLSDLTVITSDNPRTEKPETIISQILNGTQNVSGYEYNNENISTGFEEKGYLVEPDRRTAIHMGIMVSEPGDTVLIAGKGHETYQLVGKESLDFDDRVEAEKVLAGLEIAGSA